MTQFVPFIRRHRRYLVIALFLYGHSLFRWRKTRVLRVGFCLLQAIDDLLDGDRPSDADPRLIAEDIVTQLQTGEFKTDHLATMAGVLKEELDAVRAGSDDPVGEAIALIRHMTVDRERVEQSLIFDAEQLRSHHRTTFVHSLNLLLIAAGATTRASDVPELVEAFGWCSTVRDLEEDLSHGLVNVPADVVAAAKEEGASLDNTREFLDAAAVRHWFTTEMQRAQSMLAAHGQRHAADDDPTGRRILRIFDRSIGGYVRRFAVDSYA